MAGAPRVEPAALVPELHGANQTHKQGGHSGPRCLGGLAAERIEGMLLLLSHFNLSVWRKPKVGAFAILWMDAGGDSVSFQADGHRIQRQGTEEVAAHALLDLDEGAGCCVDPVNGEG